MRELGEPGQPAQLNGTGIDGRAISLQIDGRPLNDPINGSYNLYDVPIEYVDEIEAFQGSNALFYGNSAAGGTINFVTHQYNNTRPLTKLRFLQGPFEHTLTDGIYAQNISRSLNAMLGYQRHVTDGRFPNAQYDSWNVRARLRYNFSEGLNVWASDFYTKSTIGLNGGIDPDQSPSPYDEVTAIVRDLTTYQILSRHDLTAGLVSRFLPDSTLLSKALLYYSSIEREYTTGGDRYMQNSSFWGAKLDQRFGISDAAIDFGASYERRIIGQSHFLEARTENYTTATAKATIHPVAWITGEFTTRFERLRNDNSLSWGGKLHCDINEWLTIWGDYSRTYRLPTIQELFWTDTTITRARPLTREAHTLTEIGIDLKAGAVNLAISAFRRRVEDAIEFIQIGQLNEPASILITSIPTVDVAGSAIDIRLPVWRIELAGNLTYTDYRQEGNAFQILPRFASLSELSYRDQFVDGKLDLKAAIRLKAVSHHLGLQFVPQLQTYAQYYPQFTTTQSQPTAPQMPGFSSLDFYIAAKIGDATVTVVWENPLNVNAMAVPLYPLMSRNIKLGVNWVFTD